MKIKKLHVALGLCLVMSPIVLSQTSAKIKKNVNVQASGLYHDLNKTKDTLILRSDKKINYLYTANNDGKRDVNLRVDSKFFKLPLNQLDAGRNVFVAVQSPLKIVFVVDILKDISALSKASKRSSKRRSKVAAKAH